MDPALKPPELIARSRMEAGGHSNTSYIEMFAHAGTHIDSPWHFNPGGRQVMDFNIEDFVFTRVLLVDIPASAWEPIPIGPFKAFESQLDASDALLVRSGFSQHRQSVPQCYIDATPGLSVEAAQYLAGFACCMGDTETLHECV